MRYAIYNNKGRILRIVGCHPEYIASQVKEGESFIKAPKDVNDVTHKVVKGMVVNKTITEIEAQKPPEIPESEKPVFITKGQWQEVQDRLGLLEAKA